MMCFMYVRSGENIEAQTIALLERVQAGKTKPLQRRRWDADFFARLDRDDSKVVVPRKKNRDDGSLFTDDPNDIYRMFEAIVPDLDPSETEFMVSHEIQHSRAALFLGAKASYFGIRFDADGTGFTPVHKSWPLKTFRLGYASIVAHPEWLSEGDEELIVQLNYKGGVEEVAERISIWNNENPTRQCLPPLSVS